MFLASIKEVREALGFDAMADIEFAASLAMDAAEAHLAAVLNTEFDRRVMADVFYVDSPPFVQGPACSTEFRLRRGLVASLTSVRSNSDPAAFDDSVSTVDLLAKVELHSSKGIVTDRVTLYARQFVKITYVAGFETDAVDPASYNLAQVPKWLQDAAKLRCMLGLADAAPLTEANIKIDKALLGKQLDLLLTRHIRYAPMSLLPF